MGDLNPHKAIWVSYNFNNTGNVIAGFITNSSILNIVIFSDETATKLQPISQNIIDLTIVSKIIVGECH